jgi:hypothetical protein
MSLVFDEKSHTYNLNGIILPSITQILSGVGIIKNQEFFTPESAERGKAVHEACLLFLENNLDSDSLHWLISPYVNAFKDFVRESKFTAKLDLCERPLASSELGFAGTPDLVGMMNARSCIVELKTGNESHSHIQTAGQRMLIHKTTMHRIEDRYRVRLYEDGKYRLKKYGDYRDEQVMAAAVIVYNEIRR